MLITNILATVLKGVSACMSWIISSSFFFLNLHTVYDIISNFTIISVHTEKSYISYGSTFKEKYILI